MSQLSVRTIFGRLSFQDSAQAQMIKVLVALTVSFSAGIPHEEEEPVQPSQNS